MTLVEAQELRGATALITGADGFIGSHLADVCVEQGAEIRLDEGLQRTVNWYMEQRADADPRRQPVLPS